MSTLPLTVTRPSALPNEAVPPSALDSLRLRLASLARGNALYALLDQGVYSFGNMVAAALLSRHCTAWEFGIYILTQRAMDVLIQLSNVFLWAPYTFHLPGTDKARSARYQGSILTLQVAFAVAFTLLVYVVACCAAHFTKSDLYATFFPLVLASGPLLFREFTRRMYFAHLRLREAFATDAATVLLQIAGLLWLWKAHQLHVQSSLYTLAAAAGIVSLWWLLREWTQWEARKRDIVADFRRDLEIGRWFFGSNMVFLAGAQCNPWVLNAVLGGASVGAYAIAESLVNIPRVALTSMQNMMAPTLARVYVEEGKAGIVREVKRFNRMLLAVSGTFAVVIGLGAPSLARLVYHRAPVGTRATACWLALNLMAYAVTLAQSYALSALDRAKSVFAINSVGLAVQGASCLWFVHLFQISGAAIALLLGSLSVTLVRQWIYVREIRRPC